VILLKKMVRDLMDNKLAYIACILVMSIGLMIFSSMNIVMENLNYSKEIFYEKYRMADIFITLNGISNSSLEKLEDIDGIKTIQGYHSSDFRVLNLNSEDTFLKINSYDNVSKTNLNNVFIENGTLVSNDENSIMIGKSFLEANELSIGDNIDILIQGKNIEFKICASVMSPDNVYTIKGSTDIFPDAITYSFAYISEDVLKSLNVYDSYNNLAIDLDDNYIYEDVKGILEYELDKFGIKNIVPLKDQSSNEMLTEELKGLEGMSKSLPYMFLSISAFIVYIMLKRLIESQRGQIGIIMALGYSKLKIIFHYITFSIVIGSIGGIIGGILGTLLSGVFLNVYKDFFLIPFISMDSNYIHLINGFFISLFFSILAGIIGTKSILYLTPTNAMVPHVDVKVKRSFIEKYKFIWSRLSLQSAMALRNMQRNKNRSIFTIIGIMFAFSGMVVSWSYQTLMDTMIMDQFTQVQLYDAKLSLPIPVDDNALRNELIRIDNIKYIETNIELPIKFINGTVEKSTTLIGFDENSSLFRILDKNGNVISLNNEGIFISENLAKPLKLKIGDYIRIETNLVDGFLIMRISGIIPQYLGSNAYASKEYLYKISNISSAVNTAYIMTYDKNYDVIRESIEKTKVGGNIEFKEQMLLRYKELMNSYGYMSYVLALISILVGFSIVYNASMITYSERKREIASLRVLGMSIDEVLLIITYEQWFLGFIALILGIPLAKIMMIAMSKAYQTDVFSIPPVLGNFSTFFSIIGTIIFIFLSSISIKRKVKKLYIVEVLKERE
jgi:putative ABC transport system permease protein